MDHLITAWDRLGPVVREERRRAGLTQAQLARDAGVSRGWLVRLEAGFANAEPASVFPVLRSLDLELIARHAHPDDREVEEEAFLDRLLGE